MCDEESYCLNQLVFIDKTEYGIILMDGWLLHEVHFSHFYLLSIEILLFNMNELFKLSLAFEHSVIQENLQNWNQDRANPKSSS